MTAKADSWIMGTKQLNEDWSSCPFDIRGRAIRTRVKGAALWCKKLSQALLFQS